jgi:hypothetical protein
MAKMFYSLEEAAQRLGKSTDDVREMASRNEITEFRDGERLIFKVDQIDLLAGDEDEAGAGDTSGSMIPLVDSAEESALGLVDSSAGSGTGFGAGATEDLESGDDAGGTGISVFDADELEEADPSAVTQVTDEPLDAVSLESFGSGSGLMDLTRESDDTSLGAEGLLDELYGEPEEGGEPIEESDLFEGAASAGTLIEESAPAAGAVVVESVDPKASGLIGGLSAGALIACALGLAVVLMGIIGASPEVITGIVKGNILMVMGALLVVTLLGGGIGFLLGSRSA